MAAPTATARQTPAGKPLENGFRSLITFSDNPTIELYEKTVKPPGVESGDPIDITTQHNVEFRTMTPRKLKTLTPGSFKFAYDPVMYTRARQQIGRQQTFTVLFSDGSTLAFYGFLRSIEPDEMTLDDSQPEMTGNFVPTNWDATNDVEAAPLLTSVSGT